MSATRRRPRIALLPGDGIGPEVMAAALEVLDPETRFRTTVEAAGPPSGGVVAGDLYLVGGGDPVLTQPALDRARRRLRPRRPLHQP